MTDPTEKEISHGLSLLRELEDWEGSYTVVPIDKVCRWNSGDGHCNEPLYNAVVLLCNDKGVHLLGLCKHHSACMVSAIKTYREMN
jgi:hypothetical protein